MLWTNCKVLRTPTKGIIASYVAHEVITYQCSTEPPVHFSITLPFFSSYRWCAWCVVGDVSPLPCGVQSSRGRSPCARRQWSCPSWGPPSARGNWPAESRGGDRFCKRERDQRSEIRNERSNDMQISKVFHLGCFRQVKDSSNSENNSRSNWRSTQTKLLFHQVSKDKN